MRRFVAVLVALFVMLPLVACGGESPQCATVEQLSTELPEGTPTQGSGPLKPGMARAKVDLYPVKITLADGVETPSLVSPTDKLNLGWPPEERAPTVYLPARDFVVSCYVGGKGATTEFTVVTTN